MRWEKITKIFEAASALTGKERAKFLIKSCDDDAEMRSEVEKLLKSFEDSESFMQNPAVAEAASMFEDRKTLIGKNTTGNITLVVSRLGLLATVVAGTVFSLLGSTLLTLNFSAWYATPMFVTLALILLLLAYGFKISLANQPLFGNRFREN